MAITPENLPRIAEDSGVGDLPDFLRSGSTLKMPYAEFKQWLDMGVYQEIGGRCWRMLKMDVCASVGVSEVDLSNIPASWLHGRDYTYLMRPPDAAAERCKDDIYKPLLALYGTNTPYTFFSESPHRDFDLRDLLIARVKADLALAFGMEYVLTPFDKRLVMAMAQKPLSVVSSDTSRMSSSSVIGKGVSSAITLLTESLVSLFDFGRGLFMPSFADIIEKYVGSSQELKIIDLGTYSGSVVYKLNRYLTHKGFKVYAIGIDTNPKGLEEARAKGYPVEDVDIKESPNRYHKKYFDIVAINSPNDTEKCIEAANQLVKDNGLIVIRFYKGWHGKGREKMLIDKNTIYRRFFNKREIVSFMVGHFWGLPEPWGKYPPVIIAGVEKDISARRNSSSPVENDNSLVESVIRATAATVSDAHFAAFNSNVMQHGLAHAEKVLAWAKKIARESSGISAESNVLIPAALLHDVAMPLWTYYRPLTGIAEMELIDKEVHHTESAMIAGKIIDHMHYSGITEKTK